MSREETRGTLADVPRWLIALNVLVPLAVALLVVLFVVPWKKFSHHDWRVTVRIEGLVVDEATGRGLSGVRVNIFPIAYGQTPGVSAGGVVDFPHTTIYGETTEGNEQPRGPPPHSGVAMVVFEKPGYGRVAIDAARAAWTPDEPGGADGVLDCGRIVMKPVSR